MRSRACPSDRGFAAIELTLGIGLLLVPTAMVVLALPGWSERQATATAAAQEAARVLALSEECEPNLWAAAGVVDETVRGHGLDPDDFRVDIAGSTEPGAAVEVRVTAAMPMTVVPGIGAFGSWSWTARHAEPVDRYRSC